MVVTLAQSEDFKYQKFVQVPEARTGALHRPDAVGWTPEAGQPQLRWSGNRDHIVVSVVSTRGCPVYTKRTTLGLLSA